MDDDTYMLRCRILSLTEEYLEEMCNRSAPEVQAKFRELEQSKEVDFWCYPYAAENSRWTVFSDVWGQKSFGTFIEMVLAGYEHLLAIRSAKQEVKDDGEAESEDSRGHSH